MNKTPLQQYIVRRPSVAEALALAEVPDTHKLTALARQLRDHGHGNIISYSRKIFIPLTKLCRDFCHYCTFAEAPLKDSRNFMTPEEVLELVRQGEAAGCKEVLFTLGDKPQFLLNMKVCFDAPKWPIPPVLHDSAIPVCHPK